MILFVLMTLRVFFFQYFLNETLLNETFSGVTLALVLGFAVLTLVSGNIVMAFISVLNILLIVTDVFAFTVLAGYKLGVVEAILYIVVIGMSIDYSVHSKSSGTVVAKILQIQETSSNTFPFI